MWKFAVFTLFLSAAFAQKQPVTMETLDQGGRGGGGRAGAAVWAPDGRSFVTRAGRSLVVYDAATQKTRDLVSTQAIDAAAVRPADEGGRRIGSTGARAWGECSFPPTANNCSTPPAATFS